MAKVINQNIQKIEKGIEEDNHFISDVTQIVENINGGDFSKKITSDTNNATLTQLKPLINNMIEQIGKVFEDIKSNLSNIVDGKLDTRITNNYKGEFNDIKTSTNQMAENMQSLIEEVSSTLETLANGDLRSRIDSDYKGEYTTIKESINTLSSKLNQIISEVNSSVEQIAGASEQVTMTAQTLSQSASEQASSIEETSTAIEEISASINHNTTNANLTSKKANFASNLAKDGGDAVDKSVTAMESIAKNILMIEDIAYYSSSHFLNSNRLKTNSNSLFLCS